MKENILKKWNLVAIIIICLAAGFVFGNTYKVESEKLGGHDMTMDHTSMHKHVQIPVGYKIPTIKLNTTPDIMGGYNINVQTTNFTFTPQNVGKNSVPNTGHAHIYINGKKVGRIYGNWHYAGPANFVTGTNTIAVTLNSDNHDLWVLQDGETEITATSEVFVK